MPTGSTPSPASDTNTVSYTASPEVWAAYQAYAALCRHAASLGREQLAHQLVLCEPLSVAGEAPLIAAGIAWAASLCIEPSTAEIRQGTRSGAIDFTVTNLDEALRALKNEIRKGLSIAICLEGEPAAVLAEMAERGVQPDVLCLHEPGLPQELAPLLTRGAHPVLLPLNTNEPFPNATSPCTWTCATMPGRWLPLIDDLVARCLPAGDFVRRNWLRRAPRYLGRAMRKQRFLPMTSQEIKHCAETLQQQMDQPAWSGAAVRFASKDATYQISAHSQPE